MSVTLLSRMEVLLGKINSGDYISDHTCNNVSFVTTTERGTYELCTVALLVLTAWLVAFA